MRKNLFFVLLFSLLLLPNLGARMLWQDEAETALVARRMVYSNIWLPFAYDNQGPISQDWKYQFSISPLWRWHPWLQFYITAISFKLLGITTFAARFPFVLIGILSYYYFLRFLKKYGPKDPLFFFIASLLLLFSAPFLLHIRQDRYYALSVLFTLVTIDGYLDLQRTVLGKHQGPSLKRSYKYILGSIFLFHSFLPGALTLQISFWIHMLRTVLRVGGPSFLRIRAFAIAFSITLLFTLPWAFWLKIGGQNINFSFELITQHLRQHYIYIHKFIFPFFLFIPLLFPRFRKKFFQDEVVSLFSISISISILLYTINHPYFFRYLVPLIPFFIYITAWIFVYSNKTFRIIFVFVIFQMITRTFPQYLYEITHPYRGANEQLVQFFNSLDKPPYPYRNLAINYDDFTFRFHTTLRVIGTQELPLNLNCPQIIVVYPNWGNENQLRTQAERCGLSNIKKFPYEKLSDDPDPTNHKFSAKQLTHTLEVFLLPFSPK